jgi:enoyl-CoA hydratase
MAEPVVRLEVSGIFASLVLDSPATRNAISPRTVAEFMVALEAIASEDTIRAAIVTHTGSSFCAGADMSDVTPDSARAHSQDYAAMLRALVALPKPAIAKLNGHVRGAGMGIVAACDLAVAGPESSFAFGEVRLGLAPHLVSLMVLPKMERRASERYFLTGERFDARTAESIGLVTVATDDVESATAELSAALSLASPEALAETKRLLTWGILDEFDRSVEDLIGRVIRSSQTDDATEGMAAFFDKRPPRWAVGPHPAQP